MIAAWSWLAGSKAGRFIALIAGTVVAVLLMRASWMRAGADKKELADRRKTDDRIREAREAGDEIREDIGRATDPELDEQLRKHGL